MERATRRAALQGLSVAERVLQHVGVHAERRRRPHALKRRLGKDTR